MRIDKYHFILAVLASLLAFPVYAQINDVEVNLDVLGPPLEDYTPPPMFSEPAPPAIEEKKSAVIPPVPGRKPYHVKKPVAAAPVVQKAVKTEIISASPPIPPRRPEKFIASESFVEEARKNLDKYAPVKAPVPPPASVSKPRPVSGLAAGELVSPSAKDVLASINPKEAKTVPDAPPAAFSKVSGDAISLAYQPGVVALTAEIKDVILKQVQAADTKGELKRIEIHGYATAPDANESDARRVSLARTLEIRDFLVAQQIDPNRIDLRPMGDQAGNGPKERVDILFIEDEK